MNLAVNLTTPNTPRRPSAPSAHGAPSDRPGGGRRLVRPVAVVLLAVPLLAAAYPSDAAAASTPNPAGPVTTQDAAAVATRIDEFMSTQIKDSAVPGAAVAVVRGDRVLLVRGYGHDSTDKRITGDSLFRVASLSKSFTALAVIQLVEDGRLELDDPVQEHLPQFQVDDPRSAEITVRDLLDHTSGLTDATVPELSRTQPRTLQEAVASLRTAHLATTPGTTYSYHNPNYQVAARLVEQLSGKPFGTYLRRHVLAPAGMTTSTSTTMGNDAVAGLPEGHVTAYGHAFAAHGMNTFEAGDGGVVSSARDMARWLIVNAHDGRSADGTQLVSAAGMRTLHTASVPGSRYALGWETRGPATNPTRVDHSGSLFTYTAEEAIWPQARFGVVMLFNAGSPMMLDQIAISHGVFDIVEGAPPPSGGPRFATRVDTALAVLTLLSLVLGLSGVLRAGRWARRRTGAPVRRVLTLLPAVLLLVGGSSFPLLAETLVGRDVTWTAALYTWPALVVLALAVASASGATLLARLWQWSRASRRPAPVTAAAGDPAHAALAPTA